MLFRSLDPSEGITCVSIPVEELRCLTRVVEHVLGGKALGLTDVADLVILRGPGVQGPAQEQLGHHAAQAPHVDGFAEREAEDNLGSSVISGLKIGVADRLAHVTRRSEVNHLDPVGLPHRVHQHDVLGLQISVNQSKLF